MVYKHVCWAHMLHLFCNALVVVIYSVVSDQYSYAVIDLIISRDSGSNFIPKRYTKFATVSTTVSTIWRHLSFNLKYIYCAKKIFYQIYSTHKNERKNIADTKFCFLNQELLSSRKWCLWAAVIYHLWWRSFAQSSIQ